MDPIPIYILGSTVASLIFTVFMTRKVSRSTETALEGARDSLQKALDLTLEDLNTKLEPIIQVFSDIGENEDILEMVKMAFPNVAEYIEDHPEAITKLLPRLNTLISDPEARGRLKLDFKGKARDLSRIWSEDNR